MSSKDSDADKYHGKLGIDPGDISSRRWTVGGDADGSFDIFYGFEAALDGLVKSGDEIGGLAGDGSVGEERFHVGLN